MDIAESLQQIHVENGEVIGSSFSCVEKLTSFLEMLTNSFQNSLSEINDKLVGLQNSRGHKKSHPELAASKGKMSFGVNHSSIYMSLKKDLEEKEKEIQELKEQKEETEAEANEKLEAFKKEIDSQEDKIKECFPI